MVFLFSFQVSTSLSFTASQTGGEYNHLLTIDELPSHQHEQTASAYGYSDWNQFTTTRYSVIHDYRSSDYHGPNETLNIVQWLNTYTYTNEIGGSQSHNNIQPYIVTYMFKRVS